MVHKAHVQLACLAARIKHVHPFQRQHRIPCARLLHALLTAVAHSAAFVCTRANHLLATVTTQQCTCMNVCTVPVQTAWPACMCMHSASTDSMSCLSAACCVCCVCRVHATGSAPAPVVGGGNRAGAGATRPDCIRAVNIDSAVLARKRDGPGAHLNRPDCRRTVAGAAGRGDRRTSAVLCCTAGHTPGGLPTVGSQSSSVCWAS
jgi:hypothetical protein